LKEIDNEILDLKAKGKQLEDRWYSFETKEKTWLEIEENLKN